MVGLWTGLAVAAMLLLAAFALPQTADSAANAWLSALVVAVLAVASPASLVARRLLTIAATWIFVSALVLPPESDATVWVLFAVAVLLFLLSLLPGAWEAHPADHVPGPASGAADDGAERPR